jgi:hypothetical protein
LLLASEYGLSTGDKYQPAANEKSLAASRLFILRRNLSIAPGCNKLFYDLQLHVHFLFLFLPSLIPFSFHVIVCICFFKFPFFLPSKKKESMQKIQCKHPTPQPGKREMEGRKNRRGTKKKRTSLCLAEH